MRIKLLIAFILVCFSVSGHTNRVSLQPDHTHSAYMLEIGGSRITDTYLSPLRYRGLSVGVSGQWTATLAPRWQMLTRAGLQYATAAPRYLNSHMHSGMLSLSWSALRQFSLPADISLAAGPGVGIDAGVLYLPVNSNNPADAIARAAVTLNLTASRLCTIKRMPLRITDHFSMAAAGLAFAPQYGEGYYEIGLGHTGGLVHPTWPGNMTAIDNLLAIDLPTGRRCALRLGYRFTLATSALGGNDRLSATHAFCIGISTSPLTRSK